MADRQRMGVALGTAGEAVMALYALARLLRSRDLGPTHLAPAVEATRTGAAKLGLDFAELFGLLSSAAAEHEHIAQAVRLLQPQAMDLAERVSQSLGARVSPRLGARQRLEIERSAETLGRELEGMRVLIGLVVAALHAQPVDLLLANVLDGGSPLEPTFVERRAEVQVDLRDDRGVRGDPRVIWPLLEAAFRELAGDGGKLRLRVAPDDGSCTVLQVERASEETSREHTNGVLRVSLGPRADTEREVVREVAAHLGVRYEVARDGQAVVIRLC